MGFLQDLATSIVSIILLLVSLVTRIVVNPIAYVLQSLCKTSVDNFYVDKTILITGASSGIGEALAIKAAKLGANVILAGRNKERLNLVLDACKAVQVSKRQVFLTWEIDLEEVGLLESKYKLLVAEFTSPTNNLKGIDILVNNAGISSRGSCLELTIPTLNKVMNTNFTGPVVLSQLVAKEMISRNVKGLIIVNSSVQGKLAIPNRTAYGASKHALQGYFDSFRLEMEPHGIHTMLVSPGYVSTQLSLNAVVGSGEKYNKLDDNTKNGISPELLADKIFSLATSTANKDIVIADLKTNAAIVARQLLPELVWKILKNKK